VYECSRKTERNCNKRQAGTGTFTSSAGTTTAFPDGFQSPPTITLSKDACNCTPPYEVPPRVLAVLQRCLFTAPKAGESWRKHAVTSVCQRRKVVAPLVTEGTKAMHQHEGRSPRLRVAGFNNTKICRCSHSGRDGTKLSMHASM
jgi:hypothetical protein